MPGRRLADGALDTARKIWVVLGAMPPARAERATYAEATGAALGAGRRARGLGRRADRAHVAFGHLGLVGKVVDRA